MFKLPKVTIQNSPSYILHHRRDRITGYKFIANQRSLIDYNYSLPTVVESIFNNPNTVTVESITGLATSTCPTVIQTGQTVSEEFTKNSYKIKAFFKKYLQPLQVTELNQQLYNLFFAPTAFGNTSTFELISESLNLSFSWQYQQPPSLQIAFESKNIFLQEQINKNYIFVFNGYKYKVQGVSCELIKPEKKAFKSHYRYTIALEYFAMKTLEKEFSLFDVGALQNTNSQGSASVPTTISFSNSTVSSGKNKKFITVSLDSLSSQAKEIFDSSAFTYFDAKINPSFTDTTNLGSELSKAISVSPKTIHYGEKIQFKDTKENYTITQDDILSDIDISQRFYEKDNLQFLPVFVDSLDTIKDDPSNKEQAKPFTFVTVSPEIKTIVTGENAAVCPFGGVLTTTDLAFDESGPTKSKVTEVYEGSSILSRQVITYGLAYNALDIYSIDLGPNPLEAWIPKQVLIGASPSQFWQVVRTENTTYTYGQYGYLTKATITGSRLSRFATGPELLKDKTDALELYYLSNATTPEFEGSATLSKEEIAQYKLLDWKIGLYNYISSPITGFTKYYLHPIHGTYADNSYQQEQYILYYNPTNNTQTAIKNEAYTPSYFASSTYTYMSSIAKIPNLIIDKSDDQEEPLVAQLFAGESLISGEEYIEIENIKLVFNKAISSTASPLSGIPFANKNNNRIPQYTKYSRVITAQDEGFRNCTTEEKSEFNEGIPPEHTRKENPKQLQYTSTEEDNKPVNPKLNLHLYSYNINLPSSNILQKNPNVANSVLPVSSQATIKKIFTKQLQDKELEILTTLNFETFYLPQIKVGDILKVNILKDKQSNSFLGVNGIVKSMSLAIKTSINSSNQVLYKYTYSLSVSLNLPSAEIVYNQFFIQLPKEELEKEKPLNNVYIVLEPVDYGGFGEDTSDTVGVIRG